MIDDRRLDREYKELQKQNTPDLWDRIEAGIQPVDRSEAASSPAEPEYLNAAEKNAGKTGKAYRRHRRYGWSAATAAAAVLCVAVIGSRISNNGREMTDSSVTTMAEAGNPAAEDSAAGTLAAANTAGSETADGKKPESAVGEHAGLPQDAADRTETSYFTLQSVNSLRVPDHARTVPYDAEYFSEGILKETDLLCDAVITDVTFAYDESGNAIRVIYKMTVNEVYYAQDYVTGMDELSVSSPIIETDGDEAYLLYQMQIGGQYLLPLKDQEQGWELLYPFAPQIQVTADRGYVFHTGYQSLITGQAEAVEGIAQGANDFYFDRMVMREDGDFVSDLVLLMK